MSSQSDIREKQLSWARNAGKSPDTKGYLPTVEDNLRCPMCEKTLAAFENGSGSELKQKMRALHSSSALAVNFFEYWIDADRAPLGRALGLKSPIQAINYEAQYCTGLGGNPPNLDLSLPLSSGHTIAIESKFCEWLTPKPPDKEYFKPKYFPENSQLWTVRGLPNCQRLAEDIFQRKAPFRYLDVPQLLKHALGLSSNMGSNFDLYYLYYEPAACPEKADHRAEINEFAERVGAEIRFKSLTYRELFLISKLKRSIQNTSTTCVDVTLEIMIKKV